jgi:hypothetical protein
VRDLRQWGLQLSYFYPGAYLEFVVHNCSSVYLSLHSSHRPGIEQESVFRERRNLEKPPLSFDPVGSNTSPGPPTSLVSRIDFGESRYFRQSGRWLVAITTGVLDPMSDHIVRITASSIDEDLHEAMKFEGVWLNEGGSLISSQAKKDPTQPRVILDAASLKSNKTPQGLQQSYDTSGMENARRENLSARALWHPVMLPRKTLEIVSDVALTVPAWIDKSSLLALEGWQQLVGDMFGADHVTITMEGMCLTSPCINGAAQSATIKDAFFRRYRVKSQCSPITANCSTAAAPHGQARSPDRGTSVPMFQMPWYCQRNPTQSAIANSVRYSS